MSISRRVRMSTTLVGALVLLVAAAAGVRVLTKSATQAIAPTCTAGGYQVDTDQASVAAQMVGEVYKSKIAHPDRAAVLALAAALQESKLQNLAPGDGDRDSVGVLQQRPSQGYGNFKAAPLTDVTEATKEFLDKLVAITNWWTLPAATAIQDVQISADGSLYAQHEPQATALSTALLGRTPAAFTCTFDAPTQAATTATVLAQLQHDLGLTTPVATATSVRVPGAAWQTASWFVANANRFGIASVGYAGRTWTRTTGWKASTAPATDVLATMAVLSK